MCIVPATQEAKKGRHGVHSTWECSDTVANKLTDAYTNIKDTEYRQNVMDVWMNHMQKHIVFQSMKWILTNFLSYELYSMTIRN